MSDSDLGVVIAAYLNPDLAQKDFHQVLKLVEDKQPEVEGVVFHLHPTNPAQIDIPDVITARAYDLVCLGAPTGWLSTDIPIRSFLPSETAPKVLNGTSFAGAVCWRRFWNHNLKTVRRLETERDGTFTDGVHFRYEGGQVKSLLSRCSCLAPGENRQRYLGLKIPPTNLQSYHLDQATQFATGLANRLVDTASNHSNEPGLPGTILPDG